MKKFKYTAVNINKRKFVGTYLADNEKQLAADLSRQGLYLMKAKVVPDNPAKKFVVMGSKIKMLDLTSFCRKFAIMINAGMSIDQTLDVLKRQDYDKFFRVVLEKIHEDVKGGAMLSDAIEHHKGIFPHFFKSMIRVGEASGKLEFVMKSLADHYENDAEMKKKIKGAMAYPIALLLMTVGIIVLMMVMVIPSFKDALAKMDVEMPKLTLVISNISDYFVANWKVIFLVAVFLFVLLKLFGKTQKGRYFYDTLAIKVPVINKVNIARITARFARGFSLLLSSGMDTIEALEEIELVLGNKNIEKRFRLAVEDIKHGMNITMAFDSYKLFPDILIQMISVGERTAALEEVLNRSCKFFDDQAEAAIKSFTNSIQPIMLLIMGVVIAILFMAVYAPILQIINSVNTTTM